MKNMTLRSSVALLCGAILSACGGSDGSLQIAGSITGLTKTGLVLVNEGSAFAFRSLSATLCLCQALFLALGYRLELKMDEIQLPLDEDD